MKDTQPWLRRHDSFFLQYALVLWVFTLFGLSYGGALSAPPWGYAELGLGFAASWLVFVICWYVPKDLQERMEVSNGRLLLYELIAAALFTSFFLEKGLIVFG